LWVALLVCAPVTSFPLLSQTSGGETPVGPLSLIPLVALVAFGLAPYMFRGGKLPGTVRPLLGFALVSFLSAGAAAVLPLLPYKGQFPAGREIRALTTLAIGLGFYLCAVLAPDTDERRRASVRAIYVGAAVALGWATVQGLVALIQPDHVPLAVTRIHHLFSVRDLIAGRVGGLAYEPSWFGNQLMVLYIPLLAAATLERQSVFTFRRGWLSVEAAMLLWAIVILVLTRSRISQVGLLALASLLIATTGWRLLGSVESRLGLMRPTGWSPRRAVLTALNLTLLGVLVAGLVFGAAAAAGRSDQRLWALESIHDRLDELRFLYPNEVILAVGDRLAFAERLVYWTSAFRTFSLYPILGVGPGNAGFLFERTLADYGLRLTEVQNVLRQPSFGFPNPKNLWARLMAETGILGLLLYGWWFVSIGLGAAVLWKRGEGFERYLGLAGVLALVAQVIEGFSLDTYALPQLWLVFGLVTSGLWSSKAVGPRPVAEGSPAQLPAASRIVFFPGEHSPGGLAS
jgi:hypothetical protein